MMKRTHMFAGITATLPFITWGNVILLPVAIVGSVAADWDYLIGIKHRTITHSLLALEISTTAICICNLKFGLIWGLSYGLHLLLDSLTKTGVPLFYPWSNRYYGKKLFYTRDAEDGILCMMLLYIIVTFFK